MYSPLSFVIAILIVKTKSRLSVVLRTFIFAYAAYDKMMLLVKVLRSFLHGKYRERASWMTKSNS